MHELRRDTVAEADYTVLDYGWDDRIEGKRTSDNPYPVNNWKHDEWEKGWYESDSTLDAEAK